MTRSAAQHYAQFREDAASDVALRLLRSPHSIAYLSLMAARLADGPADADALADALTADLQTIGEHFTERARPVPSGRDVLDSWVRAGYVSRTLDDQDREVCQLTRGATTALSQVRNASLDRSVATESGLELVTARLSAIAVTVSPDPGDHLRALDEQIAELTRRREALRGGLVPGFERDRVIDDLLVISTLAERMPADILGYGERLRQYTADLLTHGPDPDGDPAADYAHTLARLFEGHDELAETPEGKAFDAFYALLSDHRRRRALEESVTAVIDAFSGGETGGLPPDLRDSLTGLLDRMWTQVQRVDEIRGQVYRRINTFVRSGDFLAHQLLRARITEAQRAAAAAFDTVSPGRDTGLTVPMTTADTQSVGALRLHDGVVELPPAVIATSGELTIDPAALIGREAIDWDRLTGAIAAAVRGPAHPGPADLSAVLDRLPGGARTGEVVGLWSLAARHGTVDPRRTVTVTAATARGPRTMTVPQLYFPAPVPALTPRAAPAQPSTLFEEQP